MHSPVAKQCVACRKPHQSDVPKLSQDVPGLCFKCHDEKGFKGKKVVHVPVDSGECLSCHSPHAGVAAPLLIDGKVCFPCHDENNFNGTGTHIKAQPNWCVGCHNPHQSDNEHLLRKK